MAFRDGWTKWTANFHPEMVLFPMRCVLDPIGRSY
jgi:hypothetical protein